MNTDRVPHVNLIPQERIERRRRSIWISRWSAMVLTTTGLIGLPGLYIGGNAALTDSGMSGQIQTTHTELVKHQQAIPMLETKLSLLRAEQEVLELVRNRIDWRAVFGVLVEASGKDIRFVSVKATGGGIGGAAPIVISISGVASSQTVARLYVVRLEQTGVFDRVHLAETRREQSGEIELIEFQMDITVHSEHPMTRGSSDAG